MFHTPAQHAVATPAAQVAEQTLWMNIYRSGWFHREGKADTLDIHAGDFYTSHEAAVEAIDPPHHHVATVPFTFTGPIQRPNAADSTPVALSESRRRWHQRQVAEGHAA